MSGARSSLLALLLWGAGCVHPGAPGPKASPVATVPPTEEGAGAGADGLSFQLQRYPSGAGYELSSDRGRVVLLDVWATWCEPCKDSLPVYQQLSQEFGPRGLSVYAISVDGDVAQIAPFLQQSGLSLPILLDAEAWVVGPLLRVQLVPTSVLLDRQGRVRFRHEGVGEDLMAKYRVEIEALLAEGGQP